MKQYADQNRSERSFEVGDWVFLRLQPYKQTSFFIGKDYKLAPQFYGPYKVIKIVGMVTYLLQLLSTAGVHLVFHVSMLKKKVGKKSVPEAVLPLLMLMVSS